MRINQAFELLLADNKRFITSRNSPTGTERYCIYSPNMIPLMVISKAEMKKIYPVLIKREKKWYISRKSIRSLHGNSFFKKTYKKTIKTKLNELQAQPIHQEAE